MRLTISDGTVSATVVGVGHRVPVERTISVARALELARYCPMIVRHTAPPQSKSAA